MGMDRLLGEVSLGEVSDPDENRDDDDDGRVSPWTSFTHEPSKFF
jgi:hypothetical protein